MFNGGCEDLSVPSSYIKGINGEFGKKMSFHHITVRLEVSAFLDRLFGKSPDPAATLMWLVVLAQTVLGVLSTSD